MKKAAKYRIYAVAFLSVLFLCLIFPVKAYDVNGYHISKFNTIIDVGENNMLLVTEEIAAVFTASGKHGIIRTIPAFFENRQVGIYGIEVDKTYSVDRARDYVAIRIGDANREVQGEVNYTITYQLDYGKDNEPEYDKLYHNILGTDWDCDIYNFTFTVNMPKPFDENELNITYGDRSSTKKLPGYIVKGNSISGELNDISAYQGITMALKLPEGYYVNPTEFATGGYISAKAPLAILVITAFLTFITVVICIVNWYSKGKDDYIFASPQFYPVKGQSPAEAGYIIDGVVDNKDITSLIFHWADKGYLSIHEDKRKYSFTKLKEANFSNSYENYMFRQLFEFGDGTTVALSDLEDRFYTEIPKIKKKIMAVFKGNRELVNQESLKWRTNGIFISQIPFAVYFMILCIDIQELGSFIPMAVLYIFYVIILSIVFMYAETRWNIMKTGMKILIAITVVIAIYIHVAFIGVILEEIVFFYDMGMYALSYGLLCTGQAISLAFAIAMKKRSEYGQKMLEHYIGFKDFIANAEMDRLKTMIDENPQYFYNILPYAIVLGLERKWAKKFESMVLEAPSWYDGYNMRSFSTVYLVSRMGSLMTRTTASMVKSPQSSSGSGFSGGGFSGGGGGGGGGSSW